jgi:hypothetical protein
VGEGETFANAGKQPANAAPVSDSAIGATAASVETPDPPLTPLQEPARSANQLREIKPGTTESGPSPGPTEQPSEIPQEEPKQSWQRTAFLRAAANWLARNGGLAGSAFMGAIANVEWLQDRQALIRAAANPPQTFEEMQAGVGKKRPGYYDHHVVEQTWAEYFGFSRSQIDDPENLVSIPRLKHWQIAGWYGAANPEYGGLSPRDYLADKDWNERRRVGLNALVQFGVGKQ